MLLNTFVVSFGTAVRFEVDWLKFGTVHLRTRSNRYENASVRSLSVIGESPCMREEMVFL